MDKKEKQKLYVLFGIFAVAGTLLYYNLLLRPVFLGFILRNREYQKVKATLRTAQILIDKEANINKQYENLNKEAERLERALPAEEQVSDLLEDFSNIAKSSRVKILMVRPKEKDTAGGGIYLEVPILIEAEGGYHQLGEFINKLESMDRFIKIKSIDIKGTQGSRSHHMNLEGVTYALR